jgi:peptide/nickel transport system ATP-binding protein
VTDTPRPSEPLIRLQDVGVLFGGLQRKLGLLNKLVKWRAPVVALRDVNIAINTGEAVGLVGESGSGKTTMGRLMMGLLKPTSGTVRFGGDDVGAMNRAGLKALRARFQMVYQDALGSFDPRMRVGSSVEEPLRIHTHQTRPEIRKAALDVLELIGLSPAEEFYGRFPNELSGGQQQRAGLARALVTRPEALVLDEPLSSADVSIRVRLLDLLVQLRSSFELTYIFITHDLALARYVCDRLVILYRGEVVETGPTGLIFQDPRHPYTKALIHAVPTRLKARTGDIATRLQVDTGVAPSTVGCPLYVRCPAGVEGLCDVVKPPLIGLYDDANHEVSCHYAEPGRASPVMVGAPDPGIT